MKNTKQANNTPLKKGVQTSVDESLVFHELQRNATAMNPLNTSILTLEVKDKTTEGYFKQISSNLNIAGKAIYFVCRDLYDAKVNLIEIKEKINKDGTITKYESFEAYDQLIEKLKVSRTTVKKYLDIGRDTKLRDLYSLGKLPSSWTTQYYLTTLSDGEMEEVAPKLTPEMSVTKINGLISKPKDEKKPVTHYGLCSVQILKDDFKDVDTYNQFCEEFDVLMHELELTHKTKIKVDYKETTSETINRACEKAMEKYHKVEAKAHYKKVAEDLKNGIFSNAPNGQHGMSGDAIARRVTDTL